MTTLENFRNGWKTTYEPYFQFIYEKFPNAVCESAIRYMGMLRIKFTSPNELDQFALDAIAYKLERHSVRICEVCGSTRGIRIKHDERLPEIMCLCWKCYAMEVSSIEDHNSSTTTNKEV